MPWAKLHTDILGDPKLMRAARKGARCLAYLPWLIAFAKQADDGGRLTVGGEPAEPADVASLVPGATPDDIERALEELLAIGVLIDNGGVLCFVMWDLRSGSKDSDHPSAVYERVKKHRQKQRALRAADSTGDDNGLRNGDDNALSAPLHETTDNAREKRRIEKRREEENREEKRGASAPRETQAWVAPIRERWIARVGDVSASTIARRLGSAQQRHGVSPLLAAIDAYADARLAAEKPCKLEWFADEASVWVARTAPLVDSDGILTERGMAVAGAPL